MSKELFEEEQEEIWHRERLYIDYQRELEYSELKYELQRKGTTIVPFFNTRKVSNFVVKLKNHGGHKFRGNRIIKKRRTNPNPFVDIKEISGRRSTRNTRSKSS